MYSSMHGEQIELRQAYDGAPSAAAARPSAATCFSSTVTASEPTQVQVGHAVAVLATAAAMFSQGIWYNVPQPAILIGELRGNLLQPNSNCNVPSLQAKRCKLNVAPAAAYVTSTGRTSITVHKLLHAGTQ